MWAGFLSALLLAEYVALTVRVDAALLEHTGWWTEIARQAPLVVKVLVAALAAMVLFCGPHLHQTWADLRGRLEQPYRVRPLLIAVHLVLFACFFRLTAWLFDEGNLLPSSGAWNLLGWMLLGVAVAGSWGVSLAPPGALWAALQRGLRPLLIGVAIGVVAWTAGRLTLEMWAPLGTWTFHSARFVLQCVTGDVVCSPADNVLGTSAFSVQIGKACSGYEGIGLVWVFLGLYLWFNRRAFRFPNAFLLVPLCTAVIWLANVARIVLLIAIGTRLSPRLAIEGFHSQAGWLAFNAVALGSVVLATRSRWFASAEATRADSGHLRAAAAYLAPFLAIVTVAMVAAAFSRAGDPDWLYPVRVLAAVGTLWFFRAAYTEFKWTVSWQAVGTGALAAAAWIACAAAGGDAASGGSPVDAMRGMPALYAVLWLAFRVFGYVVAMPIAEELAFRGYLTRRIIASDFREAPLGGFSWLSFVGSSVVFGVLHGRYWLGGIATGMLFAIALYRRKRLEDAVFAHATANALVAVYASVTGNWFFWA